jgi:pyruvate/2-oxoglutarate dehydrogenase complex dihydrolipoamide acyltransferase (E2) component
MRIVTATALVAILSLGTPGFVLAQGAASQAEKAPAKSGGQTSAKISSIQVVDVKQLPEAVKKQVEEVVSKSSEEDLKALRASIDASPAAANALKEKGMSSAQVVAINIADGVLTMFAKTA